MKSLMKLSLILLFSIFIGCNHCYNVHGIKVSESLIAASNYKGIDYCKLLRESIEKNNNSIKHFALLDFYDATGYEHGIVLVDLIIYIGEECFIHSFPNINKKEKELIETYISVGIEYANNASVQNKSMKEVFPIIFEFLKSG